MLIREIYEGRMKDIFMDPQSMKDILMSPQLIVPDDLAQKALAYLHNEYVNKGKMSSIEMSSQLARLLPELSRQEALTQTIHFLKNLDKPEDMMINKRPPSIVQNPDLPVQKDPVPQVNTPKTPMPKLPSRLRTYKPITKSQASKSGQDSGVYDPVFPGKGTRQPDPQQMSPINVDVSELLQQGMAPPEIQDYMVHTLKIKPAIAKQIIDQELYEPASRPVRRNPIGNDIFTQRRDYHKAKKQKDDPD